MSVWRDIFEGFTEGVLTAAAYQQAYGNGACDRGRIDRVCRELGWSVDEREGNVIQLHFNDPIYGIRKVRIADGDDCLVTFSTYSFAVIPAGNIPIEVLAYLLCRNLSGSGMGMWGMHVDAGDNVMFTIVYQALGDGIDAPTLKYICQSLGSEAADFDGKLREAKLLR
jgi:hypothetical protein